MLDVSCFCRQDPHSMTHSHLLQSSLDWYCMVHIRLSSTECERESQVWTWGHLIDPMRRCSRHWQVRCWTASCLPSPALSYLRLPYQEWYTQRLESSFVGRKWLCWIGIDHWCQGGGLSCRLDWSTLSSLRSRLLPSVVRSPLLGASFDHTGLMSHSGTWSLRSPFWS